MTVQFEEPSTDVADPKDDFKNITRQTSKGRLLSFRLLAPGSWTGENKKRTGLTRRITLSTIHDLDTSFNVEANDGAAAAPPPPMTAVNRGSSLDARLIFKIEARQSMRDLYVAPTFDKDLKRVLETIETVSEGDEDASSTESQEKRVSVSFSEVEVREYPIIVGDNPAGRKGPPVTIGWDSVSKVSIDLEKYEKVRVGHRRKQAGMHMTSNHRENILKNLGFSRKDMLVGIKAANIARAGRRTTQGNMHMSKTHEKIETIGRRIRNAISFGKKKRKEREFLKPYMTKGGVPALSSQQGDLLQ